MDDYAIMILFFFGITFGPPLILFIVGFVKRKTNKQASNVSFVLGAIWLIIGGGICATILTA